MQNNTFQNDASAKNALLSTGRVAKGAGKALRLFKKAIVKAISVFGIWAVALLALLIIFISLFDIYFEERGSSESFLLETEYENPTESAEDGLRIATSLTEPQAFAKAYYNYMSVLSHQKVVLSDGQEIHLQFDEADQTQDFAGLTDYYERENYFILSSYFIKLMDETLHQNLFCYPEQIVKPVLYQRSENRVALKPLSSQTSASTLQSIDVNITARNGVGSDWGNNSEESIWDRGLGSVLSYGAYQKDSYISCSYESFGIEVHRYRWESEIDPESGQTVYHKVLDACLGERRIPISDRATVNSLISEIAKYNDAVPEQIEGETWDEVAAQPSHAQIERLLDTAHNSHIAEKVSSKDLPYVSCRFSNTTLSDIFENSHEENPHYPITIPLIESAATFSGSIQYSYDLTAETQIDLTEGESTDEEDRVTNVVQCYGCGKVGALCAKRKGEAHSCVPSPIETAEGCGFDYLDTYSTIYAAYIPNSVPEDADFMSRISSETEAGANTILLMTDLGLLAKKEENISNDKGYEVYPLYSIEPFDAVAAVGKMREITQEDPSWLKEFLGKSIESLEDGLSELFSRLKQSSKQRAEDVSYYAPDVNLSDCRTCAYQAITFSSAETLSSVCAAAEDATQNAFIFVGKNSGIRMGTSGLGTSAFSYYLDSSGSFAEESIRILQQKLSIANNRLTGTYDPWHSQPLNTCIPWECTWWAWGRGAEFLESRGYDISKLKKNFGNGGDFYANSAGWFDRGSLPRENSWVCWEPVAGSQYGHVAFVEAVEEDGSIWVSECGSSLTYPILSHYTNYETYRSTRFGQYKLAGFIYLDSPL